MGHSKSSTRGIEQATWRAEAQQRCQGTQRCADREMLRVSERLLHLRIRCETVTFHSIQYQVAHHFVVILCR